MEAYVVLAESGAAVYSWAGKQASDDEVAYATKLTGMLAPGIDATNFKEGEETDAFWEALGGKTEYLSSKAIGLLPPGFEARLFQCSNAKGYFEMQEIHNFCQ
jgi:hypothetical protein